MEGNQKQSNAMAIVGLIVGILGIILSFVPCIGVWAIVPGLLGVIFSALGMKKVEGKGMAIAGLVLSIIASGIAIWQWYALSQVAGDLDKAADAIEEANDAYKDALENM